MSDKESPKIKNASPPSLDSAASRDSAEMPLFDHLAELRQRLLVSFIAIVIGSVVAFTISAELVSLLAAPYHQAFNDAPLIGTAPAEAFVLRLKLSVFFGVVLVSPVIFYQVWLFIAPGLLDHEKSLAAPFLLCTTSLFIIGMAFCYMAVFPFAFAFFEGEYATLGITPTVKISELLSFMTRVLLAFGIVFEMPILAYFLGKLDLISEKTLISGSRYAIVLIFVFAAILTPPDIVTQFLMAGPLILLYGLSILIVRWTRKRDL